MTVCSVEFQTVKLFPTKLCEVLPHELEQHAVSSVARNLHSLGHSVGSNPEPSDCTMPFNLLTPWHSFYSPLSWLIFVSWLHVTAIDCQQGVTCITHITGGEWADLALKGDKSCLGDGVRVCVCVKGGGGGCRKMELLFCIFGLSLFVCLSVSVSASLCLLLSLSLSLSPPFPHANHNNTVTSPNHPARQHQQASVV